VNLHVYEWDEGRRHFNGRASMGSAIAARRADEKSGGVP
jgi:hypothetical protein